VVGPIREGEFSAADFEGLAEYEFNTRVQSVQQVLEEIHLTDVDRCVAMFKQKLILN